MHLIILIAVVSVLLWCIYRLLNFWIFTPWYIHRDLWSQGVPGRYIPIVGEILFVRKSLAVGKPFLHTRELAQRFGSYYHISFGPIARLDTFDPGLINGVLKTNARAYHKSVILQLLLGDVLGYKNLLMAEDQIHAQHRRLLGPVFQHQNINSMISLMVEMTSQRIKNWSTAFDDACRKNDIFTLDIREEMTRLTLDIVTGCVFGSEIMSDEKTHATIYRGATESLKLIEERLFNMTAVIPIINRLPLPSKRKIDTYLREGKEVIQGIINRRQQGLTKSACKGPDLLDLLLATQRSDKIKFNDEDVYEEALTFVVAGHETTSNLMTWTFYNLANNPDVYHRLETEVDSVLSDHEEITVATLSLLTYTESVLKESLRFTSPVPVIGRIAVQDNTLTASDGKQIHVRKGTEVALHFSMLHHSEKYWHEPSKFDPSRFDDKQSDQLLLPFSAGIRSCIGQNFAMLEAKIMLALFIRHFHFELEPGQNFVPEIVITMRPKYGMWMRITPRK